MVIESNLKLSLPRILIEKFKPKCINNQHFQSGVSSIVKMTQKLQNSSLIQWENALILFSMILKDQENLPLEEIESMSGKENWKQILVHKFSVLFYYYQEPKVKRHFMMTSNEFFWKTFLFHHKLFFQILFLEVKISDQFAVKFWFKCVQRLVVNHGPSVTCHSLMITLWFVAWMFIIIQERNHNQF